YQWWKDGAPVSNATRDTLIINPVLISSAGRYTCVIKDQWGDSVTSAPALLTVIQSSAVNHKPLLAIKGTSNVLAGQTCQLTLSATDPDAGQILTYKVVSGPAGGSLADTTYQWTPPTGFVGLDTVVFSVTDNGAPPMSDSATIILTVSSSPTKADFTPSAMTGEYPLTVTFTNNSVNATSFSWDFGDGIASTDKNPIHTFSAPGTFTVRLLATGVTVDSLKKAIVVTRPAAPTSVAADSGVTWIRVTWTKGSASVSDTVYFAAGDTVTESGATKIANAVSPCLIRNLKVGQEYSIAVTSTTNKGAVSDFSFVVRKTTALPRGMKKILAQAKSFSMGQTGKAEPVHNVTFTHNFWMDSAEVTQKDYVSLMTATYQNFSATAPSLLPTDGDNYPEYVITWCDAALYCNARSKRDGLDTIYRYSSITGIPGNGCALGTIMYDSLKANGYHLPTEAQWEFACRAGTTTTYYWGSDTSGASQYEWYFPLGNLSTVASKKPNGFGLYDMLGNAMEFVNDYYDSTYDYYQPVDPLGPPLPSLNVNIVCRGANGSMQLAACASRRPAQPEYPWDFGACGFRVCYTDKY
ncbi:MAG TPA: SUMF1/EgtB/PvdO family nonheme iron enzyme, partial [Chitinivibrionales bacterium]|nr:SUMF1/EgtB/PvdO family nonheme iron enzyme [Chitinivibrionales bacterium]